MRKYAVETFQDPAYPGRWLVAVYDVWSDGSHTGAGFDKRLARKHRTREDAENAGRAAVEQMEERFERAKARAAVIEATTRTVEIVAS